MMRVVWKLPRDLLHSIYGDWLRWKDLSRLDIACAEKRVREVWLTSLTDLRMTGGTFDFTDVQAKAFYTWLACHKVVCVENFPFKLGNDEVSDLDTILDLASYCPALRSIVISRGQGLLTLLDGHSVQLEKNLSVFLSHCHGLREVTVKVMGHTNPTLPTYLSDTVWTLLYKELKGNSLVRICFMGPSSYYDQSSDSMVANLLAKHASSLKQLYLFQVNVTMDFVSSILIDNHIHLKELAFSESRENTVPLDSWLLPYSTSYGDLLENLTVFLRNEASFDLDHLILALASSCPKLTVLILYCRSSCDAATLAILYEQCPHLQHVFIPETINSTEQPDMMTIEVKGSNADWVRCLSYALARRQIKQVTLHLKGIHYDPVEENLKSLLIPYQINLKATTCEACLIAMLKDLPHLNSLQLSLLDGLDYTDAILVAITQHAKNLTKLLISSMSHGPTYLIHFSDKMMSEMIKACQLLTNLTVMECGIESLVTISKHSTLNCVQVRIAHHSISKEMLDGLLLDKKVKWPSTLVEGTVYAGDFGYVFDMTTQCWSEQSD